MIFLPLYKYDISTHVERSLIDRIGDAFKQSVACKLNGKVPEQLETEIEVVDNVYHPILTFLIQDRYSGTKTTVQIPVGSANPEQNIYFAGINGEDYKRYSSLEAIGNVAAEVFNHNYWVDVRGA